MKICAGSWYSTTHHDIVFVALHRYVVYHAGSEAMLPELETDGIPVRL